MFTASHVPYVYFVHVVRRDKEWSWPPTLLYSRECSWPAHRGFSVQVTNNGRSVFPSANHCQGQIQTPHSVTIRCYATGASGTPKTCVKIQSQIALRYLTKVVGKNKTQILCLATFFNRAIYEIIWKKNYKYSFCLMVEASDHVYVWPQTYTCHTYSFTYRLYFLPANPCDTCKSAVRHIHDPMLVP